MTNGEKDSSLNRNSLPSRGNMRDSCGKMGGRDLAAWWFFARRLGRSSAESEIFPSAAYMKSLFLLKEPFKKRWSSDNHTNTFDRKLNTFHFFIACIPFFVIVVPALPFPTSTKSSSSISLR